MDKFLSSNVVDDTVVIELCPRIELTNAPQVEEEIYGIMKENPGKKVTLDAENLDYISSAGLRVIIKAKKDEPSLEIINVGKDVYEIFETTGIDTIVPITKKMRELSVDGLEIIGSGFNGNVYRLDDETIVKVMENFPVSLDEIKKERDVSQMVFLMGIPSAISFDVVRVGDNYGIVYELVNAESFLTHLHNNRDKLFELGKQFGEFTRGVHALDVGDSELSDARIPWIKLLESEKEKLAEDEYKLYRDLFESIPQGNSFIHGDFHPGNVLMQDGELVLIDMGTAGKGNPMLDLLSFGTFAVSFDLPFGEDDVSMITRMTKKEDRELWNGYLHGYFGTDDEEFLNKVQSQLIPRMNIKTLLGIIKRTPENIESIEDAQEREVAIETKKRSDMISALYKKQIKELAGKMEDSGAF